MVRLKALGFCNARNIGFSCLCAVTGLADYLKVIVFICAAKSQGQHAINVPRFAGFGLSGSSGAYLFSDWEPYEKKRV